MSQRIKDVLLVLFAILVLVGAGYTIKHGGRNASSSDTLLPASTPTPVVSSAPLPTHTPVTLPPARKTPMTSLWIGDGFTSGYACPVSKTLGWTCKVDAVAGSGFVVGAHVVGTRIAADASAPGYVVLDVGRNDIGTPLPTLEPAVATALTRLRKTFPAAKIILIAPYEMKSASEPLGAAYVSFLKQRARFIKATVIDPVGAGWISPALTGSLVGSSGIDPNAAGDAYLAGKLAPALKAVA